MTGCHRAQRSPRRGRGALGAEHDEDRGAGLEDEARERESQPDTGRELADAAHLEGVDDGVHERVVDEGESEHARLTPRGMRFKHRSRGYE